MFELVVEKEQEYEESVRERRFRARLAAPRLPLCFFNQDAVRPFERFVVQTNGNALRPTTQPRIKRLASPPFSRKWIFC
jgi:hypothetical protein